MIVIKKILLILVILASLSSLVFANHESLLGNIWDVSTITNSFFKCSGEININLDKEQIICKKNYIKDNLTEIQVVADISPVFVIS